MLQRGRIIFKNIKEIENIEPEKDGLKKVIDLDYMGKIEYEGNVIPISRMFMEYYKDDYYFFPINIYNANKEQMYIYANISSIEANSYDEMTNWLFKLAKGKADREYSMYEHIKYPNEASCNFWWSITGDYLIFFGYNKIELIEYFIESCYNRDGGREEIKRKLTKEGYIIN